MKYGLQLFGVKDDCKHDTEEFFRRIKTLGYQQVEPCIALTPLGGFEQLIWSMQELEDNLRILQSLDMEVISCHVLAADLGSVIPELRRISEGFGIKQLVVKCPRELSREKLQETALLYIQIADAIADTGARLLIHNDQNDTKRIDGKTAYEWLLDACLERADAQVDVGWLVYGGVDPENFLWRNKTRVASIHYKDFVQRENVFCETRIGTGAVDVASCLQFARAFGLPQIMDQDHFGGDLWKELGEVRQMFLGLGQSRDHSVSFLNILDTETGSVQVLKSFDGVIEAPNWVKSQNALVYNSNGLLYRYAIATGEISKIESGSCDNCNNDHVLSPDEQWIAVSHGAKNEGFCSKIYKLPIHGGIPQQITPNTPSFLHGWSPDGKELAYCAFREQEGNMETDIYVIPVDGGEEVRLTDGGFNDGPEYAPNGKDIWINSTRSGLMQIWKLSRTDGTVTQMTKNDRNNWFAHVSPDGEKVVYLSYRKGELDPSEHLPNMQVELWMMDYDGGNQRKILSFFGGQGSINVNSWAEDSRYLAFVSYELLHQ